MALLGLAIGFWVRDHVRGLLLALGLWFGLLFGIDLLLLALPGCRGCSSSPTIWVLPLDVQSAAALRVTVLFGLEHDGAGRHRRGAVVGLVARHGGLWLAPLLTAWMRGRLRAGVAGARGDAIPDRAACARG